MGKYRQTEAHSNNLQGLAMAFARLFGKSKKDPVSAGEQDSEGEEGYTVVENKPETDPPPVYPNLGAANLPYLLPGGPPALQAGGAAGHVVAEPKYKRQQSSQHPLDGVHF